MNVPAVTTVPAAPPPTAPPQCRGRALSAAATHPINCDLTQPTEPQVIIIFVEDGHKVVLKKDDRADAIIKQWDGGNGRAAITIDGSELESPPGRPHVEHIAASRVVRILLEEPSAGFAVGFNKQ